MMGLTWYILGLLTVASVIFILKLSKKYVLNWIAWSGYGLGVSLVLFSIAWSVGAVLEGVPRAGSMGMLLFGLPGIILLTLSLRYITDKLKKRSVFNWIWRIVVGIFLYLFLYLTAGFILQATYPELLDFYKDKIPPFDLMIGTQFLRGLIFVVVAILILRTLKELKSKKAIFIGLVFAILGGIAPLIIPNDLMPHNIRMGHLFEVGSSNFIYGFILAYLLSQQQISEDQNKIE